MMGVVRARSRKTTVLPRENGPVNWYNTPVDLHGQPLRFPWSADFIKKVINASLRLSPNVRPDYKFKWQGRGKEHLDHQLQHLDFANVPKWIGIAAQTRDRSLSRRMPPSNMNLPGALVDA